MSKPRSYRTNWCVVCGRWTRHKSGTCSTLANNRPLSRGAKAALRWFFKQPGEMTIPEAREYVLNKWGTAVADEICRA